MVMMASMPSLARVGDDLVGDVADDFLAVFVGLVVEGIAAVGGAEDRAAAGQNAADVFEGELERFFRPDEAVEAVGDADDLPVVFEDGGLDGGADDGVEAGSVAAPGSDADTANVGHGIGRWPLVLAGNFLSHDGRPVSSPIIPFR